jgi:crotonobetainyl-CoA:carnitine CoA-transferase CaiB-like acyl-CoA transferase
MKPLDGITVLDLTRFLPGAVATMTLADFGADVLKIEEPGLGDPARHSRGVGGRPGVYFLSTNRNKRSLALNLKTDCGKDIFRELARTADVVVEGFRPGVMERLGLGYESLQSLNPQLIYCAITGYGQDGPYRLKAGHDANYLSVAGLLSVNGPKDGPPILSGVQLADLAGGSQQAVMGVLLALQARAKTGEGQLVDVSMMDGTMALMYVPFAEFLATGVEPQRGEEGLSGRYACYQIYETGDGRYLSLGALEAKFWASACRVLGRENFIGKQYAVEDQREMIAALAEIFRSRTAADWLEAFDRVDTCVALINGLGEMLDDPQVRRRGLIGEIEHPTEGKIKQIGPTVKLSATPGEIHSPPPALGEHTRDVLSKLGYDEARIEDLATAGVIGL